MRLFREHDLDALMTYYAPDATFMPPGMDVVKGINSKVITDAESVWI